MAYSRLNSKLLVVEDDLQMQMVLKKFLGFTFDVVVCPNGEIALTVADKGDIPDVITTDLDTANKQRQ